MPDDRNAKEVLFFSSKPGKSSEFEGEYYCWYYQCHKACFDKKRALSHSVENNCYRLVRWHIISISSLLCYQHQPASWAQPSLRAIPILSSFRFQFALSHCSLALVGAASDSVCCHRDSDFLTDTHLLLTPGTRPCECSI